MHLSAVYQQLHSIDISDYDNFADGVVCYLKETKIFQEKEIQITMMKNCTDYFKQKLIIDYRVNSCLKKVSCIVYYQMISVGSFQSIL